MQNYCKTIGALVAASALAAGNASAEIEYEIHTGYTTDYLFRGMDLGADLVEAGIDLSTEAYGLGLSAGAWYGSYDSAVTFGNNRNIKGSTNELDLYAEISKDFGFMTAAVGYIKYINQDGRYYDNNNNFGLNNDDAQEVYFSVAKEFYGIETSLTYFWDIETDNDGYMEAYLGKSFELSPCVTLNTGATFAYLWEEGDWAHLTAKVSLDWAFTETATLSPFIAASFSLDDNYNGGDDELVAGTMLSVSF